MHGLQSNGEAAPRSISVLIAQNRAHQLLRTSGVGRGAASLPVGRGGVALACRRRGRGARVACLRGRCGRAPGPAAGGRAGGDVTPSSTPSSSFPPPPLPLLCSLPPLPSCHHPQSVACLVLHPPLHPHHPSALYNQSHTSAPAGRQVPAASHEAGLDALDALDAQGLDAPVEPCTATLSTSSQSRLLRC